eukprot:scaffold656_cov403-Pavlova_lutheri.AAC.28
MAPTLVRPKKPKLRGCPDASTKRGSASASPDTTKFVEVPIKLSVPPRMRDIDTGIISFEGAIPVFLDRLSNTGMATT